MSYTTRLAIAVVTCTQVTSIQELFKSHGEVFHIEPVSIRGEGDVWVELFTTPKLGMINRIGHGWDRVTKTNPFGYDVFFAVCKEELELLALQQDYNRIP